ncbi:MAG: hypothetical protein ACFCVK_05480 [Acidimicrobiales bacterium]
MRIAPFQFLALMAVTATLGACTGTESELGSRTSTTDDGAQVTATSAPSSTSTTAPAAATTADGGCGALEAKTVATVDEPELTELSGLVASRRHPGTVWATNDSGDRARLFALDLRPATSGATSGSVGVGAVDIDLDGIDPVDVEDLASDGDRLYVADIGDNDAVRSEIRVYRLAEPDPEGAGTAGGVETFRFRYPDGPRDAEALFVDPVSGDLIIIDKRLTDEEGRLRIGAPAPATVFAASPPFDPDAVTDLEAVGTIDLAALAARSTAAPPPGVTGVPGLSGVVTGADIRSDGALVALRTYRTVWLFPRAQGQTVAEALAGPGCEAATVVEAQGEAVALLDPDTSRFVTIGEGTAPAVNVSADG